MLLSNILTANQSSSVFRHKIQQCQQELLWAEHLREQVKARMDTPKIRFLRFS